MPTSFARVGERARDPDFLLALGGRSGSSAWRRQCEGREARDGALSQTRPGQQLQIDFGEARVWIAEERVRVHLFVATLGYSRRMHIRPSLRERQLDWFEGMEASFLRFGGVPSEVLLDNARALVEHHDAATREVRFNGRLHAFARYWGLPAPGLRSLSGAHQGQG